MASQLDTAFFRKAKRVNRAIEIFDHEAVIPAVKEKPEVRVKLPIRRLKTIEERTAFIKENRDKIEILDGEIEEERKNLLDLVKSYRATGSGVSDIVATNLKVKGLIERRAALLSPDRWIEGIPGLTLKDVFASKRDVRKIGAQVYQIKRRVEPIESLYVDLVAPEAIQGEGEDESGPPPGGAGTVAALPAKTTVQEPRTAAEAAQGAIIGQKKVIKAKKTAAAGPATGSSF
jgi:hypothetical protein